MFLFLYKFWIYFDYFLLQETFLNYSELRFIFIRMYTKEVFYPLSYFKQTMLKIQHLKKPLIFCYRPSFHPASFIHTNAQTTQLKRKKITQYTHINFESFKLTLLWDHLEKHSYRRTSSKSSRLLRNAAVLQEHTYIQTNTHISYYIMYTK